MFASVLRRNYSYVTLFTQVVPLRCVSWLEISMLSIASDGNPLESSFRKEREFEVIGFCQ